MGSSLGKSREIQILMLGLDGAGKTSLVAKKKGEPTSDLLPTIGFSVETIRNKNLKLNMWDVGGQDSIRPLWKHYYSTVEALIYVVDATDKERLQLSKTELYKAISDSEMSCSKVLVVLNKTDLADAISAEEATQFFDLESLTTYTWAIICTSAVTGDGISDIFKTLTDWFKCNNKTTRKRSI